MAQKCIALKWIALLVGFLMLKSVSAQEIQWREFESMGFDRYNHPLIKVTQEGKQYFYHLDSQVQVDRTENQAAGMTVVIKDGHYGVIKDDGSLIVPLEYDEVKLENDYYGQWYEGIPYRYKFVVLGKNSRYGIADEYGRVIAQPQYEAIKVISKHIVGFKADNLWGWLDARSGQVLQSPAYDEIDDFLSDDHVKIQKDGKVGLAGKDGAIVIPPEHSGYFRYVYAKNGTYIHATKTLIKAHKDEQVDVLYDSLGNIKLDRFKKLGTMHHADFLTFEEEGLVGGVDPLTGDVVIDPVYERIDDGVRGLFRVRKEGLYGVLDESGHTVVPAAFSDIAFINVDNQTKGSHGPMIDVAAGRPLPMDERQVAIRKYREFLDSQAYFIRVTTDKGTGIFDWQGNMLVSPEKYEGVVLRFHKSAFFLVRNKENQSLAILDVNGEKLIEAPYELDRTYRYSKSAIENNWELRNRFVSLQQLSADEALETPICLYDLEKANMVIPMGNQRIEWLDEDYVKVTTLYDRSTSLYNREGELVVEFNEPVTDLFVVGPDHLLLKEDRAYRLADMDGNPLYQNPQWRSGSGFAARQFPAFEGKKTGVFHHGLMKLYMRDSNVFLNEAGEEVRFTYSDVDEFYTGNALATIEVPDNTVYRGYSYRYGLIDKEGNEIHPMEWENVSAFGENPNLLIVTKGGKQGLADRTGNYLLEPVYDFIEPSGSYPSLQIKKGDKSGLIDKEGRLIVAPLYERFHRNHEGEDRTWPLLVKDGDWYYFIDKGGNPLPVRSKKHVY